MATKLRELLDQLSVKFGYKPKIALVPRGGPENGPFSAMAARVLYEVLTFHGYEISAIYPSSGATPTAVLGSTGDFKKLCEIWANITSKDIVGKVSKFKTVHRAIMRASLLPSQALNELIKENIKLEKFCSPEAMAVKFQAVDILSRESVTFSNKDPRHKPYILPGILGAMALIPFLEPQRIDNPKGSGLLDDDKIKDNTLLLVDGGYKSNMMLELAMRDGYDVIFIIDVHGLKPTINKFTLNDLHSILAWAKLLRNCFHLLSNANDDKQYQLAARINEEIAVRDELVQLVDFLDQLVDIPILRVVSARLRTIIGRMNDERLRLGDKKKAHIYMVANEEYSTLFNFAKFKKREPRDLLNAGWLAAVEILESEGFDTDIVKPDKRFYI